MWVNRRNIHLFFAILILLIILCWIHWLSWTQSRKEWRERWVDNWHSSICKAHSSHHALFLSLPRRIQLQKARRKMWVNRRNIHLLVHSSHCAFLNSLFRQPRLLLLYQLRGWWDDCTLNCLWLNNLSNSSSFYLSNNHLPKAATLATDEPVRT